MFVDFGPAYREYSFLPPHKQGGYLSTPDPIEHGSMPADKHGKIRNSLIFDETNNDVVVLKI